MKRIFLVTDILVLFCACNNSIPTDYVEHTIDLKDNLGKLTISLPPEFDTAFVWTHFSDNSCSRTEKFRFANKKYTLHQEKDYIDTLIPDSLYQLTVIQFAEAEGCGDTILEINAEIFEVSVVRYMENNTGADIFMKEIKTIQGRDFIVIGSKRVGYPFRWKYGTELFLFTAVNGRYVGLNFHCQAEDCTDFINRVEKSLPSIKITEPAKTNNP
jgi:hypothetical protein